MAYQPVPDTARVVIHGETGSNNFPWSFALHFAQPGFDSLDLETLNTRVQLLCTQLASYISNQYTFQRITTYDLRTPDGDRVSSNISITGTQTTEVPTVMSAGLVLNFNASKRGPWNQNRINLPLLDEAHTDERDISEAWAADLIAVFEALLTTPPESWQWVVVSRYFDGEKRAEGVYAPVQDVIVRSYVVGTQRRRLRR